MKHDNVTMYDAFMWKWSKKNCVMMMHSSLHHAMMMKFLDEI